MKPRFLAILTITALFGLSIGSMAAFPLTPTAHHAGHPSMFAGIITGSFSREFSSTDPNAVIVDTGNMTIIIQTDGSVSGQLTGNNLVLTDDPSLLSDFTVDLSGNLFSNNLLTIVGVSQNISYTIRLQFSRIVNTITGTGTVQIDDVIMDAIVTGPAANPS